MLLIVLNILFVIIAITMVALILMQRGTGAAAGSGFGGGASATVFGARGSASFLSKATKWLAIAFFAVTLSMAWYAMRQATPGQVEADLGVMGLPEVPVQAPPPGADPAVPGAPEQALPEPGQSVPQAPATPVEPPPAQPQDD